MNGAMDKWSQSFKFCRVFAPTIETFKLKITQLNTASALSFNLNKKTVK